MNVRRVVVQVSERASEQALQPSALHVRHVTTHPWPPLIKQAWLLDPGVCLGPLHYDRLPG